MAFRSHSNKGVANKEGFWVIVCVLACISLAVFTGCAEDRMSRGASTPDAKSLGDLLAEMVHRVGVSEEQMESVRPIITDYLTRRDELIEKTSSQGREGKSALKSGFENLVADIAAQMAPLLTPEQLEEVKGILEEDTPRLPETKRGGGRSGGKSGGRVRY